jgi:DNA ligase-1
VAEALHGYATVFQLREAQRRLRRLTLARQPARRHALAGAGSGSGKKQRYGELCARATAAEQSFLGGLVLGEIRQGALDSLVIDAIAMAKGLEPRAIRSAYMLAGEIGAVAEAVLRDGAAALSRFGLTLFRPVLPMPPRPPTTPLRDCELHGAGRSRTRSMAFACRSTAESDVCISRALNDVTASVPEIVQMVRERCLRRLILDGEAIARRGGRRAAVPRHDDARKNRPAGAAPLSLSLFDVLLVDDQTLLSASGRERFAALDSFAPQYELPRLVTNDGVAAQAFFEAAIKSGHEGVMLKALDAPYEAGSRGAAWLKLKKIHRLDLVVLAVEWGSGRRKGMLSNIHLGSARRGPGNLKRMGDAGQDLQGHDRPDAGVANERALGAPDRPRGPHRSCAARARGGGGVQRRPALFPIQGRLRAAARAGGSLPRRQVCRRGRHHRRRAGNRRARRRHPGSRWLS